MTTVTQHDTHEAAVDSEVGAGKLLRDARVAKGLGIADVAASLRLDVRAVEKLEADAFDKLPGPTFVRGYLRSYTRLLDIPAGPILEAYEREQETAPALVADIAERKETRSGDFPVRMVTYGVVVVLAALVVLWWHNQRTVQPVESEDVADEPALPKQTLESSVIKLDLSAEGEDTAPPAVLETPTPVPAETEPTEEPSVVDDKALDAGGQNLIAGVAPAARASTLDTPPAPQNPPQSPVEDDVQAARPVTDPADTMRPTRSSAFSPAAETHVDPAKRLRMEFKHESWVEVYGANDERLYYDLARPGDIVELDGSAPMRVLLGYAKDVVIEYEGSPFDYSDYLSRNMARFTLGIKDAQTAETPLRRSPSVADNHSRSDTGTSARAADFPRQ